jgi:tripartite-type tricarboxylate transporter receptor subunit TctC
MFAPIWALVGRARVGLALVLVGASCAATWGEAVPAQTFPSKPVRLIVPFPPGGTTDTMSRVIAAELSDSLGQQVIIDNRPGAGGTLGTEIAAKSAADGHTILLGTISTLAIAPNFYVNLGYDPIDSFAPISLIARLPFFIFVNSSVPAHSLQDLIDLARSKPGLLNFASPGAGTLPQVAGETFKKMASVELVHVPYKGDAAAMTDLISGQVQVMFDGLGPYRPYVQAGKLRVLAAASPRRQPQLPEVPTAAEAGLPGYEVAAWFGFLAPKGTPAEIIGRLSTDVSRALRKSEVRDALSMRGIESGGSSPDEFSAFIRDEVARWSRTVKASGPRPN